MPGYAAAGPARYTAQLVQPRKSRALLNRPVPVKPDNFFLMLFHAVARRRIPLVLRIVSHTLLLVVLALLIHAWIMGLQFKHAMQEHADALGQSLLTQTAASATELLVANDILSLSVLLNNLVENPLVAYAAIHSVDNRVLAEAGSQPPRSLLDDDQGLYSAPIAFQEVIAGRLSLRLDMQRFQQPMTISLQNMGLLSLILLALTLVLSLRLGRRISTPLMQLRLWLRDPDFPAPGATRQDEIGDLARQLQARLVQDSEARQAAPARGPREREDDDLHELDGLDDLLPEDDEPAGPRVSRAPRGPPAPQPPAAAPAEAAPHPAPPGTPRSTGPARPPGRPRPTHRGAPASRPPPRPPRHLLPRRPPRRCPPPATPPGTPWTTWSRTRYRCTSPTRAAPCSPSSWPMAGSTGASARSACAVAWSRSPACIAAPCCTSRTALACCCSTAAATSRTT